MALAIIGGAPERFVPLVELYRKAARQAGRDPAHLPVSINSHAYVADTPAHARDEFFGAERLGEVIVRAQLQPDQLVTLLGSRGEHDDGYLGVFADRSGDIQPIELRQTQIEHDQIGLFRSDNGQGYFAIGGRQHRKARVFEIIAG